MGNQQQNRNLKFTGKTIKPEHFNNILDEYEGGESLMQLGIKYGYSIATIRFFLLKNDVKVRGVKESVEKFQKQSDLNLDEYFYENFIGWILGDGGLRLYHTGINPIFTYCDKKLEHINYVASILSMYNIKYSMLQNKTSLCYQLSSESRPEFNDLYKLFYGYEGLNENWQKRKILPDIILTPIILRNWYIGDGCSSKGYKTYHKGSISCKYKNEFILKQLSDKFEAKCYTDNSKDRGVSYKYSFNNQSLIKMLAYIGECPVECYKYKWITRCSTTIIETS